MRGEIRIIAYGLTHKSPVITSLDTRLALGMERTMATMERTMATSATGQNTQGLELPKWVREVEALIPSSAVRAITSKDYNTRVSVVCFKDKVELVMDALKNHGAGAKKRSTDSRGTGANKTRQYGLVSDCPELQHGTSDAFPPVRSQLRIVCNKNNMHVGHVPKSKRNTHIVSSSECRFKCTIRFFKDRTDLFLLCFDAGCHEHSCPLEKDYLLPIRPGEMLSIYRGLLLHASPGNVPSIHW